MILSVTCRTSKGGCLFIQSHIADFEKGSFKGSGEPSSLKSYSCPHSTLRARGAFKLQSDSEKSCRSTIS